jgi:acyl-coenzyme A synthetase/AMP-(fatty) acid ligase
MDSVRALKEVAEVPREDGFSRVPSRFNFTRDVIEALAVDRSRRALTFVDSYGVIDRRTFADVASGATRWAALLQARGLVPGDRVLVVVGNTPAWPLILLGALKAGLVAVPCPTTLRAHELALRGEHSDAQLVVADGEGAREVARMDVPVEIVLVEDVDDELRRYSLIQPTHDTASDDIAFILYTSGTTNEPRGAIHTHGYTWANRLQAEHWLDARPGDLVWCTATPGWAKSIWNVLLGPWSRGAEILIHEGAFDVEQRFEFLQRFGVTVLCQSPTEYEMMANHPSMGLLPLDRLRHAVSAGGPLDPAISEAFRTTLGLTVYEGYGQTENTLLVANTPDTQVKPGSMGRPTPGHDVVVIDDDGNEQPPGTEGAIALRGKPPSLFLGYWDAPAETSAMFRGSWYLTGDRATRDEDGYLWFAGRTEDIIVSAANRINPFEVERALLGHPAVAECVVVGEPNPDAGELVKAFVVLRTGVESSDELVLELQAWVAAATTTYKSPREIEFVSELPRTASGKIRRGELRQTDRSTGDSDPVVSEPPSAPKETEAGGYENRRADKEGHGHEDRPGAEAVVQQAIEREMEAPPPRGDARRTDDRHLERDERRQEPRAKAKKAAAEKARRDAAKARRAANAQAKAEAERTAAEERRHKEEGSRWQAEVQEPVAPATAAAPQAGGGNDVHDSPNAALISRVRAYARRNDTTDTDPPTV